MGRPDGLGSSQASSSSHMFDEAVARSTLGSFLLENSLSVLRPAAYLEFLLICSGLEHQCDLVTGKAWYPSPSGAFQDFSGSDHSFFHFGGSKNIVGTTYC